MSDQKSLSDIRILVVDDEPFIREVLVRILKQIGIQHIVEAEDGSDALTKLSSAKPDLIILDIMMEPMNGLKFLKTLRIGLCDAPFDMRVMVLTGAADEAILGAAMALDCDAFVKKNIGPEAIQTRIEQVLNETAAQKEVSSYHAVTIPEVILDMPAPEKIEVEAPSPIAREITVLDADIGLVVDRDLLSDIGCVLLSENTVLTKSHIDRLYDLSEILKLHTMWVRDA